MTTTAAVRQPSTPPQFTLEDGRATVRLNRPAEHNRLEPDDLDALIEIFDRVADDPACRVLVITGTGKSFSSGFDISALERRKASGADDHDPDAFENMVNRLEDLPLPTIAALNGGAYGGATDLALACDFRIGVHGMRMFMPASRLGIVYYRSGLRRYVTRLGLNNAKKLFMTAVHINAGEMYQIGYLTDLVPPAELDSAVDRLVEQLTGNAPLAVAAHKLALNGISSDNLDDEAHAARREQSAKSEDHQEALAAWREKRKAVFTGR